MDTQQCSPAADAQPPSLRSTRRGRGWLCDHCTACAAPPLCHLLHPRQEGCARHGMLGRRAAWLNRLPRQVQQPLAQAGCHPRSCACWRRRALPACHWYCCCGCAYRCSCFRARLPRWTSKGSCSSIHWPGSSCTVWLLRHPVWPVSGAPPMTPGHKARLEEQQRHAANKLCLLPPLPTPLRMNRLTGRYKS